MESAQLTNELYSLSAYMCMLYAKGARRCAHYFISTIFSFADGVKISALLTAVSVPYSAHFHEDDN